ncbi:hypothetical protein F0562_036162 [Nyssa sinensis]|uniref:Uncharacterized protein n=1 Tax=Nyssa sinensis TaxID=561372 RepID=A0A5J5AH68_9ASTE|nr:hypothetical protein F0562_036162 [Nyssa sinensis]
MLRPNFDALRDLHNSANDLLHLPIIQRALVHHQQEKWVREVSEASLRMLDVCGTTKDVLLLVKDHLQDLQSTFRRTSIGESGVENKFEAYKLHRKKLKKEMLKCLNSLKGMKKRCITSELSAIDHNLRVVVSVLREVRVTTISIVESLMSLMLMPSPYRKSNMESFASKFMRTNSLKLWGKCDGMALQTANKRLEAVEIAIDDLEVELEFSYLAQLIS